MCISLIQIDPFFSCRAKPKVLQNSFPNFVFHAFSFTDLFRFSSFRPSEHGLNDYCFRLLVLGAGYLTQSGFQSGDTTWKERFLRGQSKTLPLCEIRCDFSFASVMIRYLMSHECVRPHCFPFDFSENRCMPASLATSVVFIESYNRIADPVISA